MGFLVENLWESCWNLSRVGKASLHLAQCEHEVGSYSTVPVALRCSSTPKGSQVKFKL